jgi:hypothetical protein
MIRLSGGRGRCRAWLRCGTLILPPYLNDTTESVARRLAHIIPRLSQWTARQNGQGQLHAWRKRLTCKH